MQGQVATRPKAPTQPMTYPEFLDWLDEDTTAEWVEGHVEMASPASVDHQRLVRFLSGIMWSFAREHHLGEVLMAPFQVKLGTDLPGREPDVLFVRRERLDRLRKTWLEGPPDIAVEVMSAESAARDRGAKYLEYQAAGVAEYWLVDPEQERAEFHVRGGDGGWHVAVAGRQGYFASGVLPGFWLEVGWLWCNPLPDEDEVTTRIRRYPEPRP